jgi:hypothetical protein
VFQDDNSSIHKAGTVQPWFEVHEDELQHLSWPAQSPDLNITEPLWSVLVTRVRKRFPSPSLKQLKGVLQEEWYKIPLETVQNLYKFIPRAAAVLKEKRWSKTILINISVQNCGVSIILLNPCIFL